jgi:hypothetical protein
MANENNKHVISIIISSGINLIAAILTLKYALKASPIIKVLALIIVALCIYYLYLTITNKPKNNDGE